MASPTQHPPSYEEAALFQDEGSYKKDISTHYEPSCDEDVSIQYEPSYDDLVDDYLILSEEYDAKFNFYKEYLIKYQKAFDKYMVTFNLIKRYQNYLIEIARAGSIHINSVLHPLMRSVQDIVKEARTVSTSAQPPAAYDGSWIVAHMQLYRLEYETQQWLMMRRLSERGIKKQRRLKHKAGKQREIVLAFDNSKMKDIAWKAVHDVIDQLAALDDQCFSLYGERITGGACSRGTVGEEPGATAKSDPKDEGAVLGTDSHEGKGGNIHYGLENIKDFDAELDYMCECCKAKRT